MSNFDNDVDGDDFDDHSDCGCYGNSPLDEYLETEETRANNIRNTISDMVANFLYYDRKEDESLPRGAIQEAVAAGEITVEDIVFAFESELRAGLA